MDNLTHSLVGLFLARAGLQKATPRGTAILVVAANAPDFDIVGWLAGQSAYLHWHRNITHSLVGAPFMALIAIALVAAFNLKTPEKKIRWGPAFGIALVAVASHLILDLTNVYGVRLLLPFSGYWWHWDLTPVIDAVIWVILLLGIAAPAFSRMVGSEIGDKRTSAAGWAIASLLLVTGYDIARAVFHDHAVDVVASQSYGHYAPRRVGAFPDANPLVWRGVAEMSYGYVDIPVDLAATFHREDAVTYYKPPRTPAMQAAMATTPFQALLEFVQYPLWVVHPEDGATHVSLIDLRFGTPEEAGFAADATVDASNHVLKSSFGLGRLRPR